MLLNSSDLVGVVKNRKPEHSSHRFHSGILGQAIAGLITGGLGVPAALAGIAVTANFTEAQLQSAVSNGFSHAKNAKIYYDRIV